MPEFSEASKAKLSSCHPKLRQLFEEVVKHYDCTILCGHRGKEEQELAVKQGKSKLTWPLSKHNTIPSLAIDVVPYPIGWEDHSRFYHFAGFVLATALRMGIDIRWGGDWDGDLNFKEESFRDLPHFELKETCV